MYVHSWCCFLTCNSTSLAAFLWGLDVKKWPVFLNHFRTEQLKKFVATNKAVFRGSVAWALVLTFGWASLKIFSICWVSQKSGDIVGKVGIPKAKCKVFSNSVILQRPLHSSWIYWTKPQHWTLCSEFHVLLDFRSFVMLLEGRTSHMLLDTF